MELRSPVEIQEALDAAVVSLDELSKGMDAALDALVEAEEAWQDAYDDFVAEQIGYYAHTTTRTPSDGKLEALARVEHRTLWHTFKRAERLVGKLSKRATNTRSVITGLQSELKTLAVEAQAGSAGPRHFSRRAG